jgi:hypothetical protein
VEVDLESASLAGTTRYVDVNGDVDVHPTLTYRASADASPQTMIDNGIADPVCQTTGVHTWRYAPANYVSPSAGSTKARNIRLTLEIPSGDEAFGWLTAWIGSPSVIVHVYDPVLDSCPVSGPQLCC